MCEGGCRIIQLREKGLSEREYLEAAKRALEIVKRFGAKLIINDSIEVAVKSGADGVHLGQKDSGHREARKILGTDAIIGISVSSLPEAQSAISYNPDYLGAGAIFPTPTKPDAEVLGLDGLREICKFSPLPVVAIGGIDKTNLADIFTAGASGAAVISSIVRAEDIASAVREFLHIIKQQ